MFRKLSRAKKTLNMLYFAFNGTMAYYSAKSIQNDPKNNIFIFATLFFAFACGYTLSDLLTKAKEDAWVETYMNSPKVAISAFENSMKEAIK